MLNFTNYSSGPFPIKNGGPSITVTVNVYEEEVRVSSVNFILNECYPSYDTDVGFIVTLEKSGASVWVTVEMAVAITELPSGSWKGGMYTTLT